MDSGNESPGLNYCKESPFPTAPPMSPHILKSGWFHNWSQNIMHIYKYKLTKEKSTKSMAKANKTNYFGK